MVLRSLSLGVPSSWIAVLRTRSSFAWMLPRTSQRSASNMRSERAWQPLHDGYCAAAAVQAEETSGSSALGRRSCTIRPDPYRMIKSSSLLFRFMFASSFRSDTTCIPLYNELVEQSHPSSDQYLHVEVKYPLQTPKEDILDVDVDPGLTESSSHCKW